jgi:hypothetical protein
MEIQTILFILEHTRKSNCNLVVTKVAHCCGTWKINTVDFMKVIDANYAFVNGDASQYTHACFN